MRIGDVVGCLDSMNVLHASAAATTAAATTAVANGVHHLRHVNHAEISTRRRIVYDQDHLVIDACGHVHQGGAYGRAMRL